VPVVLELLPPTGRLARVEPCVQVEHMGGVQRAHTSEAGRLRAEFFDVTAQGVSRLWQFSCVVRFTHGGHADVTFRHFV
jgi:hypothetical protein